MDGFKEILQKEIKVEITLDYGEIGSRYQQILIVEDGKIKSIGEFLYKVYMESDTYNSHDLKNLLIDLGIEAEKYRIGERAKLPSLHYIHYNNEDILKVN